MRLFVALTGQDFPGNDEHNLAPTEDACVIVARQRSASTKETVPLDFPGVAQTMRWWLLPYWADSPKPSYSMFNARADNLEKSRAFREPFARKRCIVPVAGFYEWIREGKRKMPQLVAPANGDALLLAGVWERWRKGAETMLSFAIVTTAVNEELAFLHDRQPLMLSEDDAARWLDPDAEMDAVRALLGSDLPVDLTVTPVSDYVNNSRNKGVACLAPLGNPRFVPRTIH